MTAHVRPALGAGLLAAALVLVAPPAHAAAPDASTVDAGRGASPRAPGWTAVELGTLGGERTVPTAVNDRGQVVGRSQVPDGRWHAFLWADGVMTDLSPDAQDAVAADVSNSGHVSGWVQPAPGESADAVLWRGGTATVLAEEGYGALVNERGQVSGTVARPEAWSENPFVWTAGTRTDLAPPPFPDAWPNASVVDLNRRGQVLAIGEFYDDTDLAYVWKDGVFTELRADGLVLRGADLHERGRVAGEVHLGSGVREAAVWRDGTIERLGMLPGTTFSQAFAMNDAGLVVGVSSDGRGRRGTAFAWSRGTMRAIGTVGSGWSDTQDVNERGQVAGQIGSTTTDGAELVQPFVWHRDRLTLLGTPTPDDVQVVDLSEKGHVATVTGDFLQERGVLWVPTGRR